MKPRPSTRKHAEDLRPCAKVEICQKDEAKSCDNCFDFFHRPHGQPSAPVVEEPPAEEVREAEYEEATVWRSHSLFDEESWQMKFRYTTGKLMFDLDAASPREAFERLAAFQELFEESECGCCKSKRVVCATREWGDDLIYNLKCLDCTAQLDFFKRKQDGSLFIKRTDKEKNLLPNRGWYVYKKQESPPPAEEAPANDFEERF